MSPSPPSSPGFSSPGADSPGFGPPGADSPGFGPPNPETGAFNVPGFDASAPGPTGPGPTGYPQQNIPPAGYGPPAFPQPGFPQPGFPQPGFPQPAAYSQPGAYSAPVSAPGNGLATAAMIVGILSVVVCLLFLPGLVAIGLGAVGLAKAGKLGGAKKGQALTGIILGVLSIGLGIGTWWLIAAAAEETTSAIGDAVDNAVGAADPSAYEVDLVRCALGRDGTAIAEGTIENTSGRARNFVIEVEFVQQGEVVDTGRVNTLDVRPGGTQRWTIDGFVADGNAVRCSVVAVNNFFN